MATTTTKPDLDVTSPFTGVSVSAWPREQAASGPSENPTEDSEKPSQLDALHALLAFSALHNQVRRRKALAARNNGFDAAAPEFDKPAQEFDKDEQFVLDEVLRLVAERAVAITGADGLAIALAENNEIVLRAAAGKIRPSVGARIDRDSAFTGACFRSAQVVSCDDTEMDPRVNLQACRQLGARSMVAVPLCGRRRVIGLLEAFSSWPFGFNESDIRNLTLLAELVLGALKPEDEDRFAQSAQAAASQLETPAHLQQTPAAIEASGARAESSTPVVPLVAGKVVQKFVDRAAENVTGQTGKKNGAEVIEAKVASAPAAAAVNKSAAQLSPKLDARAATATAAAPTIAAASSQAEKGRPLALLLLVCVVIAAAFAGGVWWKLKTVQLGSAMVDAEKLDEENAREENIQNEKIAPKPSGEAAQNTVPPSPEANSATVANSSSDLISDSSQPTNSPATAQELSKFPRVTGIRHWSSVDSSTVVLDLEDQVQYEAHRLAGPERIYFDLRDTQLANDLIGKAMDVGETLVSRVRMAQPVAGMTRIVLETKANSTFSVSLEPNPYRLVVEVRKVGATPKAAVNLFPNAPAEKSKLAIVIPPPGKEDLQLRTRVPKMRIVVDAGHGGWDLGTVGRRGLLEKDLVLEIAQRLGKLLESRLGMDVIYTRQDDNYIPLDERASIANQSQADLFVSVHANYSDLPSARGVETYYTNFFSAPGSKEAGPREAGPKEIGFKDVDVRSTANGARNLVTPTLSPAELHDRIEQSRRLAASVQRSLYGTLSVQNPGLRDRGIKEAGFVVLTESAMPGILAEVSFVSSPTDEQKLRSDGYREQIAEALYRGIARYAASSHAVKMAAK